MKMGDKSSITTAGILLFLLMNGTALKISGQAATIHFYRTNSYAEPRLRMEVFINDVLVCSLDKGGRVSYETIPGENISLYARVRKCKTGFLQIELKPGKTYYIKVDGITCFMKEFDDDVGSMAFNNPNDFDYPIVSQTDPGLEDYLTTLESKKAAETERSQEKSAPQGIPASSGTGHGGITLETGDYYALIIGVEEYQDNSITMLDNPVRDARRMYEVLSNDYTFEEKNILLLENPTRTDIINAFDELSYKVDNEDNLLIFYAGHGHWDEEKEIGYWLPADSRSFSTANWLRNTTIQSYISSIPSKHTILIADACFSGGIFKTRRAFLDAPVGINKLNELPSRKAMTSGTLKEVPDESVFIEYLIRRLSSNTEKFTYSEQLFASFREAVLNNSPNIPQFGVIQNAGDEGGDFIFIRKEQPDFR